MDTETNTLANKIGVPATLELMAEESVELAHACLKYARYLRDENPAPGRSYPDLTHKVEEEMADVYIILRELRKADGLVDNSRVSDIIDEKRTRMNKRLGMKAENFLF